MREKGRAGGRRCIGNGSEEERETAGVGNEERGNGVGERGGREGELRAVPSRALGSLYSPVQGCVLRRASLPALSPSLSLSLSLSVHESERTVPCSLYQMINLLII